MSNGFSAQNLFGSAALSTSQLAHHNLVSSPQFPYPYQINNPNASVQERHSSKLKVKRTRQRVDAGEPRNTYSSIPNYSPGRGGVVGQPMTSAFHRLLLEKGGQMAPRLPASASDLLAKQFSHGLYSSAGDPFFPMPHHYLGMPQQMLIQNGHCPEPEPQSDEKEDQCFPMDLKKDTTINSPKDEDRQDTPEGDAGTLDNGADETMDNGEDDAEVGSYVSPTNECPGESNNEIKPPSSAIKTNGNPREKEESSPSPSNSVDTTPKSKRKQYQPQQVDTGSIKESEPADDNESIFEDITDPMGEEETSHSPAFTSPFQNDGIATSNINGRKYDHTSENQTVGVGQSADMLKNVQEIVMMHQRYVQLLHSQRALAEDGKGANSKENSSERAELTSLKTEHQLHPDRLLTNGTTKDQTKLLAELEEYSPKLKTLAESIKRDIVAAVYGTVDKHILEYFEAQRTAGHAQVSAPAPPVPPESSKPSSLQPIPCTTASNYAKPPLLQSIVSSSPTRMEITDWTHGRQPPHPFYLNPAIYYNTGALSYNPSSGSGPTGSVTLPGGQTSIAQSIFPAFGSPRHPYLGGISSATQNNPMVGSGLLGGPTKDEAISLVLPKKKRSKVTDTRVTKLPTKQEEITPTYFPPTMVPHPAAAQLMLTAPSRLYGSIRDDDSPPNSDAGSEMAGYESAFGHSQTLSPMHLRKAKLMFFYTRYPSSALLKAYFPDIRFHKNNTAQLVKWFSNFREFYYIQMEKYARQHIAEGVTSAEEIIVTPDSEIYRVLNLHYNRNNHIPVPATFPGVIQATMREFFKAIQGRRDLEASWKKAIYKVIARLDDPIPEYFKDPDFLRDLEG